jgi:branched-chain amino acid transport system permease protein
MQFFIEVLIGGLLSGVMYALVALGFVLIYKASGVFNFAQGAMVFFAALTFVGFQEVLPAGSAWRPAAPVCSGWPSCWPSSRWSCWASPPSASCCAAGQPAPITLFMATIGLTYWSRAGPDGVGAPMRGLDLGIVDEPIAWLMDNYEIGVSKFDLFAAGVAASLVALLAMLFQYTKVGRALRAVADDHQAALSIGIPLQTIWRVVWAVAGFVALVAGMIWGARNGVQFALTFTALKALPVLILGGFTSVPGPSSAA